MPAAWQGYKVCSSYGCLACGHVRSKSVEQNKLLCYQTLQMLGENVTLGI